MRKLIASLAAGAAVAAGGAAALETSAAASTAVRTPGDSASQQSLRQLSFTTRMVASKAIDVAPPWPSAGDYYVIAGRVTRHGAADGLSTAQCTYTVASGPVLRVCTIDYALNDGLIATSGYIHGSAPGHAVTLVVNGGTGAYRNARGYGTLQPTPTGSDVTLHLTS